jgi:peptidoglycan/LPS O-acetylase OafA/YrhL
MALETPPAVSVVREHVPPQASHVPRAGSPAKTAARPARLAWLDAIRGIAALCVVYAHFGARVLPGVYSSLYQVLDPGLYGVLVFFLISGYIIPASLERRGDVRAFWISRVFRLFPLFAVVVTATLILGRFGLASLRDTNQNAGASVLSHLFMLSDLLGGINLVVVIWTLSYEMVFYLLVTALFATGLHRRSGTMAAVFGAAALLLGGVLPSIWLSAHFGLTSVALTSDALVAGGLVLAVASHGWPRAVGAWLAAGTGLVLVAFNEHRYAYEGLTILALMFTGTLLYRAQQRQVSRGRATAIAAGVFAAAIAAGFWHIPAIIAPSPPGQQLREWIGSVILAGVTFAAGLALQHRRVPAVMAWLGLVSYSVYLVFPLLLDLYDDIPLPAAYHQVAWLQAGALVIFYAVVLGCAATTYYLVEAPMQRLGRRLAARLNNKSCRWRLTWPPRARQQGAGLARAHDLLPARPRPALIRPPHAISWPACA